MSRVSFVGTGKVGTTLAALTATSAGFVVGDLSALSSASARRAVSLVRSGRAADGLRDVFPSELWILAVPDAAIRESAQALAESGVLRSGDVVAHCSGAYSSSLLEVCKGSGCATGSIHPIRSFADTTLARDGFKGTVCAVEGEERAATLLIKWVEAIGGKALVLRAEQKLRYHAGHVFASNYLVTLVDVALSQFEQVGFQRAEALVFLGPLLEATVENVRSLGVDGALTGPIARGDAELVQQQLAELQGEERELYRDLGLVALRIAKRGGRLSIGAEERLRARLSQK